MLYCAVSCLFGVKSRMNSEKNSTPPISTLLRELHHRIEAKERSRISQANMADRLGVSTRTYLEYLRGASSPTGMRVLISMLAMVDDTEILRLIQQWRDAKPAESVAPDTVA